MLTTKDEAARTAIRTASTPKCDPGTSAKKTTGVLHSDTGRTKSRVLASPRARDVVSDTIAWLVMGAILAIIIVSSCALVWLVWPVAP